MYVWPFLYDYQNILQRMMNMELHELKHFLEDAQNKIMSFRGSL